MSQVLLWLPWASFGTATLALLLALIGLALIGLAVNDRGTAPGDRLLIALIVISIWLAGLALMLNFCPLP